MADTHTSNQAGSNPGKVHQPPLTVLRLSSVKERTGLSRSTLYLRIATGTFPKPIGLGGRTVGWLESEVADWIAARVAERSAAVGAFRRGAK
jgi:prophage regulatory protein